MGQETLNLPALVLKSRPDAALGYFFSLAFVELFEFSYTVLNNVDQLLKSVSCMMC